MLKIYINTLIISGEVINCLKCGKDAYLNIRKGVYDMEFLKTIINSPAFIIIGGILFILLSGYVMINYNDAYWGNKDSNGNYKKSDKLANKE